MEIRKLTPETICNNLDGTLVYGSYGVLLYYQHTPTGRGYYLFDTDGNAKPKYIGAEMRDACREFNKQIVISINNRLLFEQNIKGKDEEKE